MHTVSLSETYLPRGKGMRRGRYPENMSLTGPLVCAGAHGQRTAWRLPVYHKSLLASRLRGLPERVLPISYFPPHIPVCRPRCVYCSGLQEDASRIMLVKSVTSPRVPPSLLARFRGSEYAPCYWDILPRRGAGMVARQTQAVSATRPLGPMVSLMTLKPKWRLLGVAWGVLVVG